MCTQIQQIDKVNVHRQRSGLIKFMCTHAANWQRLCALTQQSHKVNVTRHSNVI